jgi:hypothetical protein
VEFVHHRLEVPSHIDRSSVHARDATRGHSATLPVEALQRQSGPHRGSRRCCSSHAVASSGPSRVPDATAQPRRRASALRERRLPQRCPLLVLVRRKGGERSGRPRCALSAGLLALPARTRHRAPGGRAQDHFEVRWRHGPGGRGGARSRVAARPGGGAPRGAGD